MESKYTGGFAVDTQEFITLLKMAQRKATIAGNSGPQVKGALFRRYQSHIETRWIVKDGVSSVSCFSIPTLRTNEACDESWDTFDGNTTNLWIADIAQVLGILKFHGGVLNVNTHEDKIVFKSNNKQTTYTTNRKAQAHPFTRETLQTWAEKSEALATKITFTESKTRLLNKPYFAPVYHSNGHGALNPDYAIEVDALDLFEACRCGTMNGQKAEKFYFADKKVSGKISTLVVQVGDELKGSTVSEVYGEVLSNAGTLFANKGARVPEGTEDEKVCFTGGLNEVLKYVNGRVRLFFFDFTPYSEDAGVGLLMTWDNQKQWIFQASMVG